ARFVTTHATGIGIILLLATAVGAGAAHAAPDDSRYHLVGTIDLGDGGPSGQLAMDATTRRLFVPHSTRLTVVDLEHDGRLRDVPDTRGVRGVALAPALGRGFASKASANAVTVFNPRSLKASSNHIEAGASPGAIVYDPGPGRAFTLNTGSNNATAINA